MNDDPVLRDERAEAVDNASHRWAYAVLVFGVVASVVVRSLWLDQACWDLLALVIVSGGIAICYQTTRHIPQPWPTRPWPRAAPMLFGAIAAVVAFVLAELAASMLKR